MDAQTRIAIFVLKKKGVIVYPTETSYGIGCRISDLNSVKRIREIKKERKKPFIILVSSKEMAEEFAEINSQAKKLFEQFKGHLTLIVPKKESVPDQVSEKKIALRISSNEIAKEIVKEINEPIISTSANLSGEKAIYSFEKAVKVLGKKVDFILDAGKLKEEKSSTIYDLKEKKVLRKGKITEKEIEKALAGKS